MDKADLSVLKMSVQTDDASLSKARKNLEGFYSSILKTAEKQSQKRADAEKSVVDQMYKRHKISKKQYDEYIKSIDEDNDVFVMYNNERVPISRRRKKDVIEEYRKFMFDNNR